MGDAPAGTNPRGPAHVPGPLSALIKGRLSTSRRCARVSLLSLSNWLLFATSVRPEPLTATAFRFFEPITAPSPDRPATLPFSEIIDDINDRPSPDGPMQAIRSRLSPN